MSERKVLNKYYPPDFDPALLPKGTRPKNGQVTVRVMLPMSIRCTQCGEWIYKGKKFNARKETVEGETYLGLAIYRFYIKCLGCKQEITFKTDPKNSDYIAESGATRNFEPWRIVNEMNELAEQVKRDEEVDAIKKLENRTVDNKRDMAIADAIEEVLEINARHAGTSTENMIDALTQKYFKTEAEQEAHDAEIAEQAFQQRNNTTKNKQIDAGNVRRLDDIEEDDDDYDDGPVENDGKVTRIPPDTDILGTKATTSSSTETSTSTSTSASSSTSTSTSTSTAPPVAVAVKVKVRKRKGDADGNGTGNGNGNGTTATSKSKKIRHPSSSSSSLSLSSSSTSASASASAADLSTSTDTDTDTSTPAPGLSSLVSYADDDSD